MTEFLDIEESSRKNEWPTVDELRWTDPVIGARRSSDSHQDPRQRPKPVSSFRYQGCLQRPVLPLYEAVGLGVVGSDQAQLRTNQGVEVGEELAGELGSLV